MQRRRCVNGEFAFTYQSVAKEGMPPQGTPARETQNKSVFQKACNGVGLSQLRVHDLRHTYGQRLRDAGVSQEDRTLLLGHADSGMPRHSAAATVAKLLGASNAVLKTRDRTMVLRVANG